MTNTRLVCPVSVGVLLLAVGVTIAPAAPIPKGPKAKPKVAFVHAKDEAGAGGFKKLLDGAGFETELVRLDAAAAADFSKHAAVVIGSDSERGWGDNARAVDQAGVPVLGLGEGGYSFFGRLKLAIGSPMGWHGTDRDAVPVAGCPFWAGTAEKYPPGTPVRLYDATGHVGIHLKAPPPDVVPIGRELVSQNHFVIVRQGPRHVLWGFTASPAKMTDAGKDVFARVCRYTTELGKPDGGGK